MHPSVVLATVTTLFLSVGFVGAQCPPKFKLVPKDGICLCENREFQTIAPDSRCVVTLSPNRTACSPICPSNSPTARPHKRQQLLLNDDGSIANCPARMISCPIDPTMDMGYECITPSEDLDNCGGCVALGQGVSCERVAGVKRTECSRGRCINHSCRAGWVLEKRSNTCIPRPRRNAY